MAKNSSAAKYWSKLTPEERSAEIKRRIAKRKKTQRANGKSTKRNGGQRGHTQEAAHKDHISYLYGKVETIIEYYAHSNGVPFSTLAEGVASLLRR